MKASTTAEIYEDTFEVNFNLSVEELQIMQVWKNGEEVDVDDDLRQLLPDYLGEKISKGKFSTWWF